MSDTLDNADIPDQVEISITSESNVYGISRAVWVEGTPFDLSFSLKTPTLYLLTIMPYQYELLGMDHILVTIEKSEKIMKLNYSSFSCVFWSPLLIYLYTY